MLIAHWLACIWYSIGKAEATAGIEYGWLFRLGRELQQNFSYINRTVAVPFNPGGNLSAALVATSIGNVTYETVKELVGGPDHSACYVSALYFTTSSITSVGFGNIAANTPKEKIFSIIVMVIGCKRKNIGGFEMSKKIVF